MDPNKVTSPKDKLSNVKVLYTDPNKWFSIASLEWDGVPRIGIRWNGEGGSVGFPASRGYGTWFVLPPDIAIAYGQQIGNVKIIEAAKLSSNTCFQVSVTG